MDCKKNKCSTVFRDFDKTATCVDTNILKSGVNLNQLDYYSPGAMFSLNIAQNNGAISTAFCTQSIQYMDLPDKSILFDTIRLLIPKIATQTGPLKVEVGIYEVKNNGTLVIGDTTTYSDNSKLIHKATNIFEQVDSSSQLRDLGIVNIKFNEDITLTNQSGVYYFLEIGFFGLSGQVIGGIIQTHTSANYIKGYSWVNRPQQSPDFSAELPNTLSHVDAILTINAARPYYLLYKDYYN